MSILPEENPGRLELMGNYNQAVTPAKAGVYHK